MWQLAGEWASHADGQLVVDIDVLVSAHSDKEDLRPAWKKTSGTPTCSRSSTTAANPMPDDRPAS